MVDSIDKAEGTSRNQILVASIMVYSNKSFISDNRIHSITVHRFLHINVKGKIHNTNAYTYIHLYTEHNNKKTWETTTKSNHPLSPAYEEAYSSASLILIYL